MPNRIFKESLKTSPEIDKLTWFEEVVFERLILTVDDYGCFDGRVIVLRNELFPTKDCITRKNVEDAIKKLESVKLLVRYEVEGKPYIYLPTWGKHQRIRNQHRKYPEPPDIDLSADCGQLTADCLPESESESNPNPNPNRSVFTPPSIEEVSSYCLERNNGVDPQRFIDFYASKGWMVGKNKMKDWKACIRTWERRNEPREDEPLPVYDDSSNPAVDERRLKELLARRTS